MKRSEKTLIIIFFTLTLLIAIFTILVILTPLKEIIFKKPLPIAEETKETKPEKTTSEITGEETEQTIEETTTEEETTTDQTTEEETTKEKESKPFYVSEAKHQGKVLEIDYENKTITIENANTGEIEELDVSLVARIYYKYSTRKNLEDIEVGYYISCSTIEEEGLSSGIPSQILFVYYAEERWW